MIILANYHVDVGCNYHRIEMPMRYLGPTVVYHSTPIARDFRYWEDIDIMIFNRIPTMPSEEVLELRKKYGFKIVVDIDDHWILYPHHEMAEAWKQSKAHEQIQMWIREADMVFTTNERLQVAASAINKNSHVVPNGLPFDSGQFESAHIKDQLTSFLYAGGSSHYHDLVSIRPVMKRLGDDGQFTRDGRIVLAGYDHEYGLGKVSNVWEDMRKVVAQAKSYATLPVRRVDSYMKVYRSADISLAPLERSAFNACKSNLKILEAGCSGIPIIASYVEPYSADIGCPGVILCDTNKEWYRAIKMLLNDKEARESLGKELSTYVREKYSLTLMNAIRRKLFRKLLSLDS